MMDKARKQMRQVHSPDFESADQSFDDLIETKYLQMDSHHHHRLSKRMFFH
jgi:hypothetical protein